MTLGPHVTIYADGACTGNPGPGGYGAVIERDGKITELSGGYASTTNNRMELLGVIVALESLDSPSDVVVRSDSLYVVKAMQQGWAEGWRANGWRIASRQPAKNRDLWTRLLALCERHSVTFEWVRGHAGVAQNERCDALAVAASRQPDLPPDVVTSDQPSLF
jgi:ribonuclease HI